MRVAMPSPNNTNLEGLYLDGPPAAYDSVRGLGYDVPPCDEATMRLLARDNVDQGNVSKPTRDTEAMDDDEPEERDNSKTIDKMCKHAKKHFSPGDWDEFHSRVKAEHGKVMAGDTWNTAQANRF